MDTSSLRRSSVTGMVAVVVAAASASITGCVVHSEAEVYVGDLLEVAETQEPLRTPAEVHLEMVSESQCEEDREEVARMMRDYLPEFEARECYREDFTTYLAAEITMPVMSGASGSSDELLAFQVQEVETGGDRTTHAVRFLVDGAQFQTLSERIQAEYYQEPDVMGSNVVVTLNNDLRDPVHVASRYVFMDGAPVAEGTVELERRERVQIRLSDVARGLLVTEGGADLLWVSESGM